MYGIEFDVNSAFSASQKQEWENLVSSQLRYFLQNLVSYHEYSDKRDY